MRILSAVAAVALFLGLTPAQASPVTSSFSYSNIAELNPVTVRLVDQRLGVNTYASAGEITLIPSFGAALTTFCFDIQHDLTRSGTFTLGGTVTGALGNAVNALLSHVLPTLGTDKLASAALQVAIWKTEYADLAVTSGNLGMLYEANSYLQNVKSGAWIADPTQVVSLLNGNGLDQSQVHLTAVPEPASFGILALALLGAWIAVRRRRGLS